MSYEKVQMTVENVEEFEILVNVAVVGALSGQVKLMEHVKFHGFHRSATMIEVSHVDELREFIDPDTIGFENFPEETAQTWPIEPDAFYDALGFYPQDVIEKVFSQNKK